MPQRSNDYHQQQLPNEKILARSKTGSDSKGIIFWVYAGKEAQRLQNFLPDKPTTVDQYMFYVENMGNQYISPRRSPT